MRKELSDLIPGKGLLDAFHRMDMETNKAYEGVLAKEMKVTDYDKGLLMDNLYIGMLLVYNISLFVAAPVISRYLGRASIVAKAVSKPLGLNL